MMTVEGTPVPAVSIPFPRKTPPQVKALRPDDLENRRGIQVVRKAEMLATTIDLTA